MEYEEEGHILRVRSLVGLLPMVATTLLDGTTVSKVPGMQRKIEAVLEKQNIERVG